MRRGQPLKRRRAQVWDDDFEGAGLQPLRDFVRGAGLPQEAFRGGISDIPQAEGVFLLKYLKEQEDSVCQVKSQGAEYSRIS